MVCLTIEKLQSIDWFFFSKTQILVSESFHKHENNPISVLCPPAAVFLCALEAQMFGLPVVCNMSSHAGLNAAANRAPGTPSEPHPVLFPRSSSHSCLVCFHADGEFLRSVGPMFRSLIWTSTWSSVNWCSCSLVLAPLTGLAAKLTLPTCALAPKWFALAW